MVAFCEAELSSRLTQLPVDNPRPSDSPIPMNFLRVRVEVITISSFLVSLIGQLLKLSYVIAGVRIDDYFFGELNL
jgi:hypothetical protein